MGQVLHDKDAKPIDEKVVEAVRGLTGDAARALEEIVNAIEDAKAAGVKDPNLRQIIHQVFMRSVREYFTMRMRSTKLPPSLLEYYRASSHPERIALSSEFPSRQMLLDEALRQRRSIRDYAKEPMPLEQLAEILRAALGKTGEEDGYGVRDLPLFPYPSIGGLSAIEVGVVAQRVQGLEPGYYIYDQVGFNLVPKIRGDLRLAMQDVTFESEWLLFAPVIIVLVHRASKFEWKYHTRGYRLSHIDMGAALQNLYLSAWASGIGVCAVAGFLDEPINRLLGYDGRDSYVSLIVGMGAPARPLGDTPSG